MRVKTERVLQLMEANGLSVEKLSYHTGLSTKSVEWILQNGAISEEALERIADVLKVSAKDIFRSDELGCPESGIEWLRGSDRATCQFIRGRFATRVKRLATKHPKECEIVAENKDGSIVAHIPVTWIKINPTRELSEEQKKEIRKRFEKSDDK